MRLGICFYIYNRGDARKETNIYCVTYIQDTEDICVLIPRTCEYIPLHGKSDFAHAIEQRILNEEIILGYSGRLNVIIRSLGVKEGCRRVREEM